MKSRPKEQLDTIRQAIRMARRAKDNPDLFKYWSQFLCYVWNEDRKMENEL